MKRIILTFLFIITASVILHAQKKTITFESKDGIPITADLYISYDKSAPFILLCHQAGWSRGEYLEIAPKLNKMGFNCMAIDQRSGGEVNEVINQTKIAAEKAGKELLYHHAIPDMKAAIQYVKKNYTDATFILWGSSYSSALSLKLGGDYNDVIDGVLAFAPGEYFERAGLGGDFITKSAKNITQPVFITSAKNEHKYWKDIYAAIPSSKKASFLPETEGNHGSRALWEKFDDHQAYWKAVTAFLEQFK